MRAAWDALPPALQATIHPLVAEHALAHSRDRVQKGILSAKALAELPPVKQRLFRDNPINGRRALYIGAHAGHIVDWPEPIGKALLYELAYRAEQPEFMLSHAWREGDVIVWDNRAVLHRATYYDRRQAQAPHAAHDHRRRRADRPAIRRCRTSQLAVAQARPDRSRASRTACRPACRACFAVATITIGLSMAVLRQLDDQPRAALHRARPAASRPRTRSGSSMPSQIALMVSLLPVAALADIVGYRHVYRAGLALFCLASLGCVLAPSLPWLIAARTVQGLGGAAIMAIQPALVRSIYPRNMLGRGPRLQHDGGGDLAGGRPVDRRGAARRSGRGRSCSRSISRSASSPSSWPSASCRTPTHVRRPFDFLSAIMSGITFGLLIFGIDGMAHGHSSAMILRRARRRGGAGHAVRLAPDAARRSDDAGRHVQAADLLAVDQRPRPAPSPRRASPSSACRSSSIPCWARARPTPASC